MNNNNTQPFELQTQNPDLRKALMNEQQGNDIRKSVEGIVSNFGPIGSMLSGVSSFGRKAQDMAMDENGIYKSKFAKVAANGLDPVGAATDLFKGQVSLFGGNKLDIKELFKTGSLKDSMNTEQKERQQMVDTQNLKNDAFDIAQTKQAGATMKRANGEYVAPQYGRRATKFNMSL